MMVMLCVVGLVLSCAGFVLRTQTVKADSFLLWIKSGNAAPVAANVTISGALEVDQELTGTYTYSDAESDLEGTSIYQWYRADDNSGANTATIAGATKQAYTTQVADAGKFLRFEVIPVAQTGTSPGNAATSAWRGPVSDPCLVTTEADSGAGSLRQVLAKNPCCATITFASGVTAITLGGAQMDIPGTCMGLTIDGGSGVTISGNDPYKSRVLYVNSGANVRFRGLQIQGGYLYGWFGKGAGIYNAGGAVTIEASTTVRSNWAENGDGGGIYNDGETLTLNGAVSGNTASYGGGIYNKGTLTIGSGGAVSGNRADIGGGIYSEGSVTGADPTTVYSNTATSDCHNFWSGECVID